MSHSSGFSQRIQMLNFGIKSPILMIFPLFFFFFFFLPTEQPTATLLLRRAFPNRFPGNSHPKLHYPSLFSCYYLAFFFFWESQLLLPPWKSFPSFFWGHGEGLEQPQEIPQETPIPRSLGFLGMTDLVLLQEFGGGDFIP